MREGSLERSAAGSLNCNSLSTSPGYIGCRAHSFTRREPGGTHTSLLPPRKMANPRLVRPRKSRHLQTRGARAQSTKGTRARNRSPSVAMNAGTINPSSLERSGVSDSAVTYGRADGVGLSLGAPRPATPFWMPWLERNFGMSAMGRKQTLDTEARTARGPDY